jgi:uncharacterized protein
VASRAWRAEAGALIVAVRLTPRAARNAIDGCEALADGRTVLKARVRAVAEKGKANAALEALLADALGVPKSAASVVGGATGRHKTVRVEGPPAEMAEKLRQICGAG